MNDRDISMLLLDNMGNFRKLVKSLNSQRYGMGKILTERQFFVLISMKNHGKIELKNLSKELQVSTSSLCILLNKLVEQGFVYREEDSRDRRNTFYGMTEEGKITIDNEIDKFISIVNAKTDLLNQEKKDALAKSLSEVREIIKTLF